VTHSVVGNILLYLEVVHTVSSDGTIVGMMYRITLHQRVMYSADHVEVDGVATESKGLTSLS